MSTSFTQPGFSFDTIDLFPEIRVRSAPAGETIIRLHSDFSPVMLRKSTIGGFLVNQEDWYDSLPWANEKVPAGVYHLLLPVPDSSNKTFAEQNALLLEGEEPAPLVVVMLAMLCMKQAGKPDLLNNGWVRCRETIAKAGCRVRLTWSKGRLRVSDDLDEGRSGIVWLASSRRA